MATIEAEALDRADMARLREGQDAALNDLMNRHATAIFQFLYRMVGTAEDANDLAQEAFVRVYRHRDRFRPDSSFSTWVFTIAANLARNQLRWRARHPTVPLDATASGSTQTYGELLPSGDQAPDDELLLEERRAAVRAAVAELPGDLREALLLFEFEDRSMTEAATILGTTQKGIESRLYRARGQLRERLKRWLAGK